MGEYNSIHIEKSKWYHTIWCYKYPEIYIAWKESSGINNADLYLLNSGPMHYYSANGELYLLDDEHFAFICLQADTFMG